MVIISSSVVLPRPPKIYMSVPTAVAEWKSRQVAG